MSSEQSILFENGLSYKMPNPMSVAKEKKVRKQYFHQRTYTDADSTMVCDWNSGNGLIDPLASTLSFNLQITGDIGDQTDFSATFGRASAVNLFRNVKIQHRSGQLLSRTERANVWSHIRTTYTKSEQWKATIGEMAGIGVTYTSTGGVSPSTAVRVVIPLSMLDPFFTPVDGKLIPAQIASGLRVELDLEAFATSLLRTSVGTSTVTGYIISDPYFLLEQVALVDSASASLQKEAAQSGLEYTYSQVFTSPNTNPSNAGTMNIQVRKSVSFAEVAYGCLFRESFLTDIDQDSFNRLPYVEDQVADYRLGSDHFPNNPIPNSAEAYMNTQNVFDRIKNPSHENSVTLTEFRGQDAIYSVSLERDTSLLLSGQEINSSRVLESQVVLSTPYAFPLQFLLLLEYTTVCRATTDNCSVKS